MMTEEDEAFNEIERQAKQRKESVRRSLSLEEARQQVQAMTQDRATLLSINPYRDLVIDEVLQRIKELRPAIMPLEGMGRGKATQEWFDILVKHIEEMKK
jgi:DNA-binding helix-hairpin-helix protein with protein kinase domain